MVGRAAQGRPWHVGALAGHAAPEGDAAIDIALGHYDAMLDFYGAHVGIRHARKHLGWYLDRLAPGTAPEIRGQILMAKEAGEARRLFDAALRAPLTERGSPKAA